MKIIFIESPRNSRIFKIQLISRDLKDLRIFYKVPRNFENSKIQGIQKRYSRYQGISKTARNFTEFQRMQVILRNFKESFKNFGEWLKWKFEVILGGFHGFKDSNIFKGILKDTKQFNNISKNLSGFIRWRRSRIC